MLLAHASAALVASALLTAGAHAEQGKPPPMTPAEPTVTVTQPSVSEAQPNVGPPLSELPDPSAVSIQLESGQVSKTVHSGQTIAMPLGQGSIDVLVQFPTPVDGHATSVTLGQIAGQSSWEVLPRDPLTPDQIAFELRGTGAADLTVEVQPPVVASAARFGLHISPTTVITTADAGGTVLLKQGDRFALDLPGGYTWSVSIADQTIVSNAQDDPTMYEARQAGSTTLVVSGDPLCLRSRPSCLIPSLNFEVRIVVTGA